MTNLYTTIEDLREYITELYHNQQYTEREVLAALLNYGVQTDADRLRCHLDLWQLSSASAPSQDADPHRTFSYNNTGCPGRNDPIPISNDRMQVFLREDHEHERLALRMTNVSQNSYYNENIDLSEQPSNQHSSTGERPKRQSNHDKR